MASSSALITRALCGAYRSARRAFSSNSSSSSASGRMVTGTHLLRIEQYPFLKEKVAAGKAISSTPFNVGGKEWRFHYYPNGVDRKTAGSACAGLELTTNNRLPLDAVAEYEVSIIGRKGKLIPYSVCLGPRHFNFIRTYQVRLCFFKWLAPWFLDDDGCLNVQCDVTALELDTESYER